MPADIEKDVRPLEIYKKILAVMTPGREVAHVLEMTGRFGDKATALFSLLFDNVNFFSKPDDPDIVAARFIMYLKEGK